MARRVAAAVAEKGGRTYYVGGIVRDWLLGRENKDVDIEVHGVCVRELEDILNALGQLTTMGASFGIMGLRHYDLDIAMPRSEKATGRGHKDFEVFVDPFIGAEKAAMRRDFTMNALMQDVLTDEVLDFFGGREDMARGRIRHVNDITFAEDPLRVFRAAQFAARFGFEVAEDTTALSATMDVAALPAERVMGELEKALIKAKRPSIFFEELKKMRQLKPWFEELANLSEAEWRVGLLTLDEAAGLRDRAQDSLCLALAALCLGLDVPGEIVPKRRGLSQREREAREFPRTERLITRLTGENRVIRYVLNMADCHLRLTAALETPKDTWPLMEIFDDAVSAEDLLLLEQAVHAARRIPWAETDSFLRDQLAVYRQRMALPCLMGRDLMEAGVKPGPRVGDALALAHRLRLAGVPREEQLKQAMACIDGTRGDGA